MQDKVPAGDEVTAAAKPRRPFLIMLPLIVFGSIALLFAFALTKGDPSKLPSALIGKPAPRLTLAPLDGLSDGGLPVPGWSGADLTAGEPTVVNFFASWCVPCVQEHPFLMQLKEKTGVRILGINHKDPSPGGRRFIGRYGNPYSAVGVDGDGRVAIEWGVYGMPETFVVDGSGRIVLKHVGPITADVLAKSLIPSVTKLRDGSRPQPPGGR